MSRISVYDRSEFGDGRLLGWFDDDKTTEIVHESKAWDGNNMRGVMSGLEVGYETLLRTAKGRWVRHYNARNEHNGPEYYEFLTDDQAKEWLVRNNDAESEKILERYFGELEDEAGPSLGGRPEIGPKWEVRLDTDTRAQVEALAEKDGVKRADVLRRLIVAGLAAQ